MRLPGLLRRAAEIYGQIAPILLAGILIASLVPMPQAKASSQLSGPFGSASLQLTSFSFQNTTGAYYTGKARVQYVLYSINGTIFVGGSWYYINQTYFNETTTSSATKIGSAGASATNSSASASASASATATTTASIRASFQTEVPAPIKLYGYAKFYFVGGYSETEPLEFNGTAYYSGSSAFFRASLRWTATSYQLLLVYLYVAPVNPSDNETIGSPLTYAYAPSASSLNWIDLYNAIVALPQFNDTMLFAYATRPSQSQPALPLAPYYNLMAMTAIIVLIPISLIDLIPSYQKREQAGFSLILMKISMSVLLILIFPFLYDRIAYLMNILNQMIIAYPLPYYDYTLAIAGLETYLLFPSALTPISIISTSILFVGYAVVDAILWILNFMLGTIRILLIAGMIILFPLSVALRDFRYTSKLGRMIEETLFGLMLATILSASMLGIANFLLTNWSSPANMFRLAGVQSQWVAISAVVGALLAPTVLAPLVSAVYESTSMMASVAGGIATAQLMGLASGMLEGAGSGMKGVAVGGGIGLAQSWFSSLPLIGSLGHGRPLSIYMHHAKVLQSMGKLIPKGGQAQAAQTPQQAQPVGWEIYSADRSMGQGTQSANDVWLRRAEG